SSLDNATPFALLAWVPVYCIDPETSTAMVARRLVSSMYWRITGRWLLAMTRQSRFLGSSPGEYSRCSANSTENPLSGELWRPVREATLRLRAYHSKRRSTPIVSGGRRRMQAGRLRVDG